MWQCEEFHIRTAVAPQGPWYHGQKDYPEVHIFSEMSKIPYAVCPWPFKY